MNGHPKGGLGLLENRGSFFPFLISQLSFLILFQFFRLRVQKVKPLVKKGEEGFEGGFDEEVENKQEYIHLPDSISQSSPDNDHRHKEKINEQSHPPLPLAYPVDIGDERNAVRKK